MKAHSTIAILQQEPLFEVLNQEEIQWLSEQSEYRVYPKFEWVYQCEDPSQTMYLLLKGIIKIGNHADDAREVIKSILNPGILFGELGLVGESKRQDFARVMNQEVHLVSIPVSAVKQLMQRNHALCLQLLETIGYRLRQVEKRMESLIFKDARARIIDFLKDSANQSGRRVGYETLLKHCLTQQDIANITGTSRQTVTSVLNELRKENLIYFNRRSILIRDMAKLA